MSLCTVENCQNQAYRRGLCNSHRLRLRRKGTTDGDPNWVRGRNCKGSRGQCPAAKKLSANLHYVKNAALYKVRAVLWQKKNPEYMSSDEVQQKSRERMVKWSAENKERKREADKKFYENNRALVNSYKAKRRAVVLKASPPWLTAEMIDQIRKHYAEAERLTRETGVEYEVDHIVPLQGKIVCGLHVPWNLRVITAVENNRRSRVFSGL